jgi:transcriptional regulator with XRE-family HTH domain
MVSHTHLSHLKGKKRKPDVRFGKALRSARVNAGLSLREVGELGDICHSSVAEFETAKCRPTLGMVIRLAETLSLGEVQFKELLATYLSSEHTESLALATGLTLEALRVAGLASKPMSGKPWLLEVDLGGQWFLVVEAKGLYRR